MITYGRRGEVKVHMKLMAFVSLLFAAVIVFMVPALLLSDSRVLWYGMLGVAVVVASWSCLAVFDGRSPVGLGLWHGARTLGQLAVGTLIGGGCIALAWGAIVLTPWFGGEFSISRPPAAVMAELLVLMLLIAIAEEILYRGYAFQLLARKHIMLALIIPGVLFVAFHGTGADAFHPVSIMNLFLAHVWFGMAFLRTRGLACPIGLHFGWNMMLGPVLGGTVSGSEIEGSWLKTSYTQSLWTGNEFGMEGGLLATAAIVVGTASLLILPRREPVWPDLALERNAAPHLSRPMQQFVRHVEPSAGSPATPAKEEAVAEKP